MYERFTDRARKVMQLANQEAQRFNHEYIGTEHILLGLVKEGSGVAANVLKNLDIDLRKIRLEVEKIVQSGPDMVTMGKLPQTPRAKKVIDYVRNIVEPEILSYGGGHDKLSQNQFDALCSLKYNFGGYGRSDLKKAIDKNPNPKKNPEIQKHFTTGWKDPELKDRRVKEYSLYSSGDYVPYNA